MLYAVSRAGAGRRCSRIARGTLGAAAGADLDIERSRERRDGRARQIEMDSARGDRRRAASWQSPV